MTDVLMTGISGFVGSNLASELVKEGYNVTGLIRHVSERELVSLKSILDRIRLIKGDLTSYHSMNSVIDSVHPRYVLHLGALTPVRLSFEDPLPYIETNFKGTVNVVHAILERAPKARLIFSSTAEVYGMQKKCKPIEETAPLNPISPYAVSKEAADQYVRMAMRVYGLKATIFRPTNTYGRRNEKGFLIEYLIDSMLRGKTCYIGAPDSMRDYMFISDHVQAYLLAIKTDRAVGEVFNVSPGNSVTNREVAETAKEVVGFNGKIVDDTYPPGYPQRPVQWDPPYLVLDSAKISKVLGWKPAVTLEKGIEKTVKKQRELLRKVK